MSCEQINPQLRRGYYKYKKLSIEKIEFLKRRRFENKLKSYKRYLEKKKEKFFKVSNNLSLVRFSNSSGYHMNCFRFFNGESKEHILKKLEICIELKNMNHKFLTEAIFVNGYRCDVLDLTDGTIYEILNSESDEKFEEKIKNYPKNLDVIKVRC